MAIEMTQPMVFVVDDDASMRGAVSNLIRSVGFQVEAFTSAQEFLASTRPDTPCCLILDVRLPQVSGFDIQAELTKAQIHIPIIFVTGHGDVPMSVKAMKAGAVEFLTKPFRDQDLLDAVRVALKQDRSMREQEQELVELQRKFDSLTAREQQVVSMAVSGLLNKQIAGQLNTA